MTTSKKNKIISIPSLVPSPDNSLVVSGVNARYFTNDSGDAIFLAGFHTWYDVQDGGSTDPPPVMNWAEYLAALVSYGCNFTKLWALETAEDWSGDFSQYFDPPRYDRTGPGTGNNGKAKFNLTRINNDYLDRLYSRATECANNGIYVCVQFFQGWQIDQSKGGVTNPWTDHPYELANNINSVDGDDDNDGEGTETHWPAAQGNNVLGYQEDLVEAIIDRLNHLDNIIYEISNEDTDDASGYNTSWQEYMISHIQTYEAGKNKQHPVGMTKQFPDGEDSTLDSSGADWVSYSTTKADAVHSASDPVSMYDTDHTVGITSQFSWAWEALCNGHGGSWYMDEWDGALYGTDRRSDSTYQLIRSNLGYVLAMANAADLVNMVPTPALCSTGYCIAKDQASNADYICYNPNALNSFTLDLTNASGTLNLSWRNCETGATTTDTVSGGAERTLTNPWTGDVSAVRVYH